MLRYIYWNCILYSDLVLEDCEKNLWEIVLEIRYWETSNHVSTQSAKQQL